MQSFPTTEDLGLAREHSINPLVLDLLDWLAPRPRPYAEVMDVWRTSCPRLTIWEDAVDLGFVVRWHDETAGLALVALTPAGDGIRRARRQRA
jgi:hypothetical protein